MPHRETESTQLPPGIVSNAESAACASAAKNDFLPQATSSSSVCITAAATPLSVSAAAAAAATATAKQVNSQASYEAQQQQQQQPHPTEQTPRNSSSNFRGMRRAASCQGIARDEVNSLGDRVRLLDLGGQGLECPQPVHAGENLGVHTPDDIGGATYAEIPVPELKAILIKALGERMQCNPSKPHVLIIILGGTICMDYAYRNTCLRPARLARKLMQCPELGEENLPHFDILEWESLVDSSDIGKEQYCILARQIEAYYSQYDGFVILHGTDTMAYTASVLSFVLENLGKPVVLTGSMLPMRHISSDAKRNVGLSLMVAGYSDLSEVVVVFGSNLLRGTRVTKADCASINAFLSPNFPAIGSIGMDIIIHDGLRAPPPTGEFGVFLDLQCGVCTVKLTPGLPQEVLEAILATPVRPFALVLELYGSGTAPNHERFLHSIKQAMERGIAVVASTQCHKGATNLLIYENGVWISSLGVICARDMTPEAIAAKLFYLMGKGVTGKRLKELMETNMRGEVTVCPNKVQGRNAALDDIPHTELALEIAEEIGGRGEGIVVQLEESRAECFAA